MKILVTGGAGFIGSNFVRMALTDKLPNFNVDEIIVLDLVTYAGDEENLAPIATDKRYKFVKGDIRDLELAKKLMGQTDYVVHFAAESHVDRSIEGGSEFVSTNVMGTQVLLDAARSSNLKRFLHVSTDEVYGSISEGSWPEDHPLLPNSPYSASKAGSDLLVRAYNRTHKLDTVITRCSNNYGQYQFPEKVMPLFITNIIEGKKVPPELTNVELTHKILAAMGVGEEFIQPVEDRKGHDLRYSVDITKINSELGYSPQVNFEQGLEKTINWYKSNEAWWRKHKQQAPAIK